MAYFKLSAPTRVLEYPYDFHSHFSGILPVHGKDVPSLSSWLDESSEDGGGLALFEHALKFMMDANPFEALARRPDKASYERGECTAESIYIASVLIAQRMHPGEGIDSLPVTSTELYRSALESVRGAIRGFGDDRAWALALIRYFNGKIYSSNKFTPFDDAYKMRSNLSDAVNYADPKDKGAKFGKKYRKLMSDTLAYLETQGIRHIQIPVGLGDIDELNAQVEVFNAARKTEYRALVHTPSAYVSAKKFSDDLDALLKKLLAKKLEVTIGLDVLGVENRVANYGVLFNFLRKHRDALTEALKDKRSKTIIVHIHNGEGASAAADHRSMIGYYMAYGDPAPDDAFYRTLADYIGRCAQVAAGRRANESAGSRGAPGYGAGVFSRLYDELFLSNSLTHRGCLLRRFDVNGERSRELAVYNAKRSVMALSETLDAPIDPGSDVTWYAFLTGEGSPYTFRLGHDYYYRSFMAAKYPLIAFDTNIGSNSITGAAALFPSAESYRINRGFRHLDGYIDTNVLTAAAESIIDLSSESLTREQMDFYLRVSHEQGPIGKILDREETSTAIRKMLNDALGPLAAYSGKHDYDQYVRLVVAIVGDLPDPSIRYQAMTRVYAVFLNWRSCLLGADGQGVEHSDIQDEFVRLVIMIAYFLLPVGQTELTTETLFGLQQLILSFAESYWLVTVGSIHTDANLARRNIETLEGYHAPASVVCLQRRDVSAD